MSKFPAGSKIIITNPDQGETYSIGDIFEVAEVYHDLGVKLRHNGDMKYVSNREFEAYTEPFKIGDLVEVTAENAEWEYSVGDKGTVDCIDFSEPKIRLKEAGYVHTWNLKLAPAKAEPTKKIKVLATRHPREYEVGDILEVSEDQAFVSSGELAVTNKHGIRSVVFSGQWEYYTEPVADELAEREKELLEVTPRTIAFTDIQKGDTIRAEYTQNGIKHTREGTVATTSWNDEQWFSAEGDYVADSFWKGATYTLLERPEPPKPNPFAEAGVGSVAGEEDGYVWLKTANDAWQFFRQTEEHSLSGSVHNDTHMNNGCWVLLHTA